MKEEFFVNRKNWLRVFLFVFSMVLMTTLAGVRCCDAVAPGIEWEIVLDYEPDRYDYASFQATSDGGVAFARLVNDGTGKLEITKVGMGGVVAWKTVRDGYVQGNQSSFFQATSDGGVAFATGLCMTKLGIDGAVLWQSPFDNDNNDLYNSFYYYPTFCETSDGGLVFMGITEGSAKISKLGPDGIALWRTTLDGYSFSAFFGRWGSFTATSDGGVVFYGPTGGGNAKMTKLEADGTVAWETSLKYDMAPFYRATSDGGVAIVEDEVGAKKITKLEAGGAVAWQMVLESVDGGNYFSPYLQLPDGGFAVARTTNNDVKITKYDERDGGFEWETTLDGFSSNAVAAQFNLIAASNSGVAIVCDNLNGTQKIMKLEAEGTVAWEMVLDEPNFSYSLYTSFLSTPDGGDVILGFESDGIKTTKVKITKLSAGYVGGNGEALTVDVLERGTHLITTDYFDEKTNPYRGVGLICEAPTDGSPYLDADKQPLTELLVSKADKTIFTKKGFTADGNTRLIIRAQAKTPGVVRFSAPSALGGTLESLAARYGGGSTGAEDYVDVIATDIGGGTYQASAVLISPKDFPESYSFPNQPFQLTVTQKADSGQTSSKKVDLRLHAVPVLLIHGLHGDRNPDYWQHSAPGVWTKLVANGLAVDEYTYDGHYGPAYHFPEVSSDGQYEKQTLFRNIAQMMREKNRIYGIACTRVDMVAHSMGGLMARRFTTVDWANKHSIRAYKQGLVRRIITIATPHAGSPWSEYFLGNESALHVNDGNRSTAEKFLENRDLAALLLGQYMDEGKKILSPALEELRLNKALGYPSVPMYSLYGRIKGDIDKIDEISQVAATTGQVLNVTKLDRIAPFLLGSLKLASKLGMAVADIMGVLFGNDDHDGLVSEQSAKSGFTHGAKSFEGLFPPADHSWWTDLYLRGYDHGAIVGQDEVGKWVFDLLKGPESMFMTFSQTRSANAPVYSGAANTEGVSRIALGAGTRSAGDDIETCFSISTDAVTLGVTDTVTCTVTSSKPVGAKVMVTLETASSVRVFEIPRIAENTYQAILGFGKGEGGVLDVSCYAIEDGKIYVSEKTAITVIPDLSAIENIRFSGDSGLLIVEAGEERPFSLLAELSGGEIYDITSPLMGTTYQVENTNIARITPEGRLLGVSDGTTKLTATNSGLSATVEVVVGSEKTGSIDPDDPITPGPATQGGGGGCAAGAAGNLLFAIPLIGLMLVLPRKRG
jgi:hypothetical protein